MLTVRPSYEILTISGGPTIIEAAARTCYKSEAQITAESADRMMRQLRKSNHKAMLEFGDMTVKFVTNRGVTHEFVRHRICSFAQESTRFCNYGKSGQVTYCIPAELLGTHGTMNPEEYAMWVEDCEANERAYLRRIAMGWAPGRARGILANDTKTEIVVKANFREWQHIFDLRSLGLTGKPHADIEAIITPLRLEMEAAYPSIFAPLNQEPKDG